MLDGEISEKTWKAFQKGDVSVFTRRLATLDTEGALEKARGKFAKDTEFDSPSAAAAVIHGGGANGLTAWKDANGKSLKELEEN